MCLVFTAPWESNFVEIYKDRTISKSIKIKIKYKAKECKIFFQSWGIKIKLFEENYDKTGLYNMLANSDFDPSAH